ncbi:MAG: hypothetical protein K2I06_08560 [Ruminococcus sp.]|nr:hypothetical protein [Ruminococcus sp.]
MNIHYNVTITGSKEEIKFTANNQENSGNDSDAITRVQFKFNSNDDCKDRDRDARIEVTIWGKADTKEDFCEMNKLANWSKETSDVYRTVKIEAFTTELSDNISRNFEFDGMFCLDYTEDFTENGVEFMIFMAQRPNHRITDIRYELI